MPAGQFQQRSELVPKGIYSEAPEKAKRNPREGISGNFHSQRISKLAPKGSNFEVPAEKFLCSLQFLHRSELASKVSNSKVPAGEFLPTDFEIQILVFNFRRVVEYTKI